MSFNCIGLVLAVHERKRFISSEYECYYMFAEPFTIIISDVVLETFHSVHNREMNNNDFMSKSVLEALRFWGFVCFSCYYKMYDYYT